MRGIITPSLGTFLGTAFILLTIHLQPLFSIAAHTSTPYVTYPIQTHSRPCWKESLN